MSEDTWNMLLIGGVCLPWMSSGMEAAAMCSPYSSHCAAAASLYRQIMSSRGRAVCCAFFSAASRASCAALLAAANPSSSSEGDYSAPDSLAAASCAAAAWAASLSLAISAAFFRRWPTLLLSLQTPTNLSGNQQQGVLGGPQAQKQTLYVFQNLTAAHNL